MSIGKLESVELRELWLNEPRGFSKWLENNVDVLSEALGLSLTVEEREKSVGSFKVDLIANDEGGDRVIIENQLEQTNHDHLGKLLTYLVNLDAHVAVWIVKEARPEHTNVISWLNEISPPDRAFYLVELKAYRIADSDPAPLFSVVVKPSEDLRDAEGVKREFADIDVHRLKFWQQLLSRANEIGVTVHEGCSARKDGWLSAGAGKSGLVYSYVIRNHKTFIELEISTGDKTKNKRIFDSLFAYKDQIEQDIGAALTWDRGDEKNLSRILFDITQVRGGLRSPEDKWPSIQDAMIDAMNRFFNAFKPHIQELRE